MLTTQTLKIGLHRSDLLKKKKKNFLWCYFTKISLQKPEFVISSLFHTVGVDDFVANGSEGRLSRHFLLLPFGSAHQTDMRQEHLC